MRPTTRKVTAQRKFAQGAYVPPAMAATPSTSCAAAATAVRREVPGTSQEKNTTVICVPMTATQLLDHVCVQSTHSHLQPIVLVERLREEKNEKETLVVGNNDIEKVRKKVQVRSKIWKRAKPRPHVMQLRKRYQRFTCCQKLTTPVVFPKVPKSLAQQQAKRVIPQPKRVLSQPKVPKKTNVPKKGPPGSPIKRKISRRFTRDGSEFSLDDNRPLKYFAKSSTPKANQANSVMGPPTKIPPMKRLPGIENVDDSCEHSATIEGPAAEVSPVSGLRNKPKLNVGSQHVDLTLDIEPSSSVICIDDAVSEHSYYSEKEIHRWLDGSIPERTERGISPRPRETDDAQSSRQLEPEQSRPPETALGCPAIEWETLKDVTDAPKILFDSRCKMCSQCKCIEKLMRFTTLLKRQKKIDCFGDGAACQFVETSTYSAVDCNKYIIIDLLPRHPHIMIKIQIQTNLNGTKVAHSCLIPRSNLTICNEFILADNKELLEQAIINLSISCGRRPLNSDVDDSSLPGCSGDQAESAVFVKPVTEDDTEEDTEEDNGELLDAPVFYPTKEEFADPLVYIEKIWDQVSFGICKICPPPGFVPPCKADDDICFEVSNQYISRLYNRWGLAARKMSAIKASVQAQSVEYNRPLKLEGVELNLPKLYLAVQRLGGLEKVFNERKWGKVSDELKLNTNPFTIRKLERIYTKYILPYDTLSASERHEFLQQAEYAWRRKQKKLLKHANNPLHHQKRLLGDSESSDDDSDGKEEPHDAEDCVKPGSNMNLAQFKKIASTAFDNFFRNKAVNTKEIESEYWRIVLAGTDHVCVNSASIDTGELGLGFAKNRNDEYSKHPWNLKKLSENPHNVLRSLGPALGVTVPTLHLGMIFSTSCWHRDPHSIPWMEYLHQGPIKIWYGIPEEEEMKFRQITELLHPTACQNKSLWLPSDISMVPPTVLREHTVKVYRVEQKPGEFVLVMPRAYSCSISTGYSISESTYFATHRWLDNLMSVFTEIRESCEPTMFALEQLLKSIAEDPRTTIPVLKKIKPVLDIIFHQEIANRALLTTKGVKNITPQTVVNKKTGARSSKRKQNKSAASAAPAVWNVRDLDECELCRCTLYLSKVKNIPLPNSTVCLTHALELLSKKKYAAVNRSELEMLCAFDTEELLKTMSAAHERLA